MSAAAKVVKYEVSDVIRSRWLLGYTAFFLAATEALLRFGGDPAKALISLTNVVLLAIPLVTIVFGTMYVYSARAFTEVLLAQPVGRGQLFTGLYLGLTLPLSLGFVAGIGIPFLGQGTNGATVAALLAVGVALTFAFTAAAFVIALQCEDRVKALGIAIAVWLVLAIGYDALVLILATTFANYPLERPLLALMLINPIDLGRVILLLHFDISALMGYTGAVFKHFFGTAGGQGLAGASLLGWVAMPVLFGARAFRRKDF